MKKFAVSGILILQIILFSSIDMALSESMQFNQAPAASDGKTGAVILPSGREVVNIVFGKFENGYIYSDTGTAYKIGNNTKILNNTSSNTTMKLAELVFESGTLISITLK